MLREILQGMLDEAGRVPLNTPVRRVLKGGLHLAVALTNDNVLLAIARDKKYPSAEEWKTTLNHFPYYVPQVAPTSFVDSFRRFAMRAKLPRREAVAQQLGFDKLNPSVNSDQLSVTDESNG